MNTRIMTVSLQKSNEIESSLLGVIQVKLDVTKPQVKKIFVGHGQDDEVKEYFRIQIPYGYKLPKVFPTYNDKLFITALNPEDGRCVVMDTETDFVKPMNGSMKNTVLFIRNTIFPTIMDNGWKNIDIVRFLYGL